MKKNVFIKPKEQSEACFDSALARKGQMKSNILMIFALLMLMACGGKKSQTEKVDADEPTEMEAQEDVPELTFANMEGIYDCLDENMESVCRITLNNDGTATWNMIGSQDFTEYTYTIHGSTICLSPKDVDSEDDCYDYDPDTRTLENEQGAIYYRQI